MEDTPKRFQERIETYKKSLRQANAHIAKQDNWLSDYRRRYTWALGLRNKANDRAEELDMTIAHVLAALCTKKECICCFGVRQAISKAENS